MFRIKADGSIEKEWKIKLKNLKFNRTRPAKEIVAGQ